MHACPYTFTQAEARGFILKNFLALVLLLDVAAASSSSPLAETGVVVRLPSGTPPLFRPGAGLKSSKDVVRAFTACRLR